MDIKHNYIDTGSGKTLILLHGNNDSLEYFHQQIEAFSPFYRVVALDTRGHGKTPRGNAPFTLVQFAEDLFVFMKRLHIKKAHILGFSDGANIAIAFALKYPLRPLCSVNATDGISVIIVKHLHPYFLQISKVFSATAV